MSSVVNAAELTKQQKLDNFKKSYVERPEVVYPDDNKYSDAKRELGKKLYFDPRLSRSEVMSCATCHNPSFGWGDNLPKGIGDFHKQLGRKTPTIQNIAWDELFFWDGRAASLEEQALGPIASKAEMGMPLPQMVETLKGIKGYEKEFKTAFPDSSDNPITEENVSKAIANFERTVISGESPFDKWVKGDEKAISDSAKNGFLVFNEKGNCVACHSGWSFSDSSFHDIGLKTDDVGRAKELDLKAMQHAFKTVGLRNIELRGPYMHDGSLKTLMDVVNHYDHSFVKRDSLSQEIRPLKLTESEKTDLVAFMKSLTSKDDPVSLPILPQ
jgi:cytochrome c peroxidase